MDKKTLFVVISLILVIGISPSLSFAGEEDEFEDDEDREGFGIMEREREHQDEGIPLGSGVGNIILYGTIAAIIASIGYAAFKIISSKRRSTSKS